ncbi:MAG: hypothetical protein AAF468_05890 [Pseudomonadota bacterium]
MAGFALPTALVSTGLIAFASAWLAIGPDFHTAETGSTKTVSDQQSRQWTVQQLGLTTPCVIQGTYRDGQQNISVKPSKSCALNDAGLDDVERVSELESGDIVLETADGRRIAQFTTAEQSDLESIYPASPLLTLSVD